MMMNAAVTKKTATTTVVVAASSTTATRARAITTNLFQHYRRRKMINTNSIHNIYDCSSTTICQSVGRRKSRTNQKWISSSSSSSSSVVSPWLSSLVPNKHTSHPNHKINDSETFSSYTQPLLQPITTTINSTYQSSNTNNNNFLEKVTQRILSTKMGELNSASIFELITAISSWHSRATSNQYDKDCFFNAYKLFNRLIDEITFTSDDTYSCNDDTYINHQYHRHRHTNSNNNIKIPLETINVLLDNWRIINNCYWIRTKKISKITQPNENDIQFAMHGMNILNQCIALSNKYGSDHPNGKSFNMVLDGLSKLGLAKDALQLFHQMEQNNNYDNNNLSLLVQHGCRPDRISYNSLLASLANSYTDQVENANKAYDILETMLNLYNQTGNEEIKPDLITFGTVISAYANAAKFSSDAPYQAENIVKMMIDMYTSSLIENGGDGEWFHLRPNSMCFTSLIEAYNNSGLHEGVDRVLNVITSMQKGMRGSENIEHVVSDYTNKHEDLMNKMISISASTGDQSDMPLAPTFIVLFDCLAQSAERQVGGDDGDAAVKAENILKHMESLYEAGNDRMKPTTIVYNALINVWAKSMRPDAGERAEKWLNKMEKIHLDGEEDIKPDLFTFSSTIHAYAKVNNGKDAERLFMRMYEAYRNGNKDCKPNQIAFSAVINAYANRGEPRDVERLLEMMSDLELEGLDMDPYCNNCLLKAYVNSDTKDSMKMAMKFLKKMDNKGVSDAVAYSTVLEKLSQIGNDSAAKEGEGLLRRMWLLYEGGNAKLKPTATVYNSLINLLSKSNNPKISQKAIDLLNELKLKHDETKDPALMPNKVTFNAALSALAKGSDEDNVEKAKAILEQMEQLHNKGYSDVKPDAFTLTNMISCYAHSKRYGAEHAEEILNHMQESYEKHGDASMRPTKASFGAVLNAWAREGNAERAQAIVDHMEVLGHEYDEMSPNFVVYNTLINSWSKSGSTEAGKRSRDILQKMQTLYENGNKEVKPTRITYNSVMSAYNRSGDSKSFDYAKELLKQMETDEDISIQPDVVTYTTFLNIASKYSNSAMKIDATEKVLAKLVDKELKPNNFFCDAIFRVCIFTNKGVREIERKALVLCIKALTLIQESPKIVPTSYSYSLFFKALSQHSSGIEQYRILKRTLQDCCDVGLLSESILSVLRRSFEPKVIQSILFPNSTSLKEMSIHNLPREWRLNATDELPTGVSQRKTMRSQHNTSRTKIRR